LADLKTFIALCALALALTLSLELQILALPVANKMVDHVSSVHFISFTPYAP